MTPATPPPTSTQDAPLAGVSVVDHTTLGPGPYCTAVLGRLGARVVKFEPPGGDPARAMPTVFSTLNGGKESVVVNLNDADDLALVRRAVSKADVFVHSWRPNVAARFGLDGAALLQRHPALVYCAISGFGSQGPLSKRPGQEITYLAASGALRRIYPTGRPGVPTLPLGDGATALSGALRIAAALLLARSTGLGSVMDVSIAGALGEWARVGLIADGSPLGQGVVNAGHGVYATADGHWVALGVLFDDRSWDRLCRALSRPDLEGLRPVDRFTTAVRDEVAAAFAQLRHDALASLLDAADVPWSLVVAPGELDASAPIPSGQPHAPALNAHGTAIRQSCARCEAPRGDAMDERGETT